LLLAGGAVGVGGRDAAQALDTPPVYADGIGTAAPHVRTNGLTVTRVAWRVDTDQRLIALTFDDGPLPDYTRLALDVCAAMNVRATFNLVGSRVEAHPDLARAELFRGHEVGNHTWSHRDMSRLSAAEAYEEVAHAHRVIERVTGQSPRHLRPPYGHLDGTAIAAAGELGYDIVLWSLQMHETEWGPAGNARYVLQSAVPGTILLAHDAGNSSRIVGLRALPAIVQGLRGQGYRFVTTSELLAS
jgi:peptidoglycan/xylan/chitin deacetylase (PgdA/CDA1 family)